MQIQRSESDAADEIQVDVSRHLKPPLSWHVRRALRATWIPLVIVGIAVSFYYVPQLEARKEQNALAVAFFDGCAKTLRDTGQLPKVPDEALLEAIRKRSITTDAVNAWAPQVWSDIQKKQWVAHIQFSPPRGYSVEKEIGPVVAEGGYDTPSVGP